MELTIHHVDAFARGPFAGNPAAVSVLEEWPADGLLQQIAAELNLPVTAFVGPGRLGQKLRDIRWFTPRYRLVLCGHGLLAAAHVLFEQGLVEAERLEVYPALAALNLAVVKLPGGRLEMSLWGTERVRFAYEQDIKEVQETLGVTLEELWIAGRTMIVLRSEREVRELELDLPALARLDRLPLMFTAPGDEVDFVSRCFTREGAEDAVTGSAHCGLAPYWAERLGKRSLHARQLSARGGELWCTVEGEGRENERVRISGYAVEVMRGVMKV